MIHILYNSQYNTDNISKTKHKEDHLSNIIFSSNKYNAHIDKKKQIIKKPDKKPKENTDKNC